MFRHIFKITIRNFLRFKSFAIINIFNPSFGLIIFILFALILPFSIEINLKPIDPATYTVETSIWEYILTGDLVLLVTLITVTFHTRKASKQNPIDALRYE